MSSFKVADLLRPTGVLVVPQHAAAACPLKLPPLASPCVSVHQRTSGWGAQGGEVDPGNTLRCLMLVFTRQARASWGWLSYGSPTAPGCAAPLGTRR